MKRNRFGLLALIVAMGGMIASCTSEDDVLDDLVVETNEAAPFQWTRAEDVETRAQFLRNFGVGYSYDAVRGKYCDWQDIRCQVLDRQELETRNKQGKVMLVSQVKSGFNSQQTVRYSQRDYVASMDLQTKQEIDLGLYSRTKRTRQYVLEDGLQDCFYYMVQDNILKGEQYITPAEVQNTINKEWFAGQQTKLLTRSFQDAIEHLAWNYDATNYALVDSFINVGARTSSHVPSWVPPCS